MREKLVLRNGPCERDIAMEGDKELENFSKCMHKRMGESKRIGRWIGEREEDGEEIKEGECDDTKEGEKIEATQ